MSKVLQERGFESLPSSTETNSRDHVKSILTIFEADASSIRHIGSHQYAVSTGQNSTLLYKTKQMTILFLSRLNGYYYEEKKGSYGPQFSKAYSKASHINNSIPKKEKDQGSFTLSCFINNIFFDNALADLGASVSVMPLSTYLNLGLGELAHTKLTVELPNRTVKYPKGIAENVLVGIGKFVFTVDFIILDMPEDIEVPLILKRPFFSTTHAKIDVFKRKITLKVGEEKIILSLDPFCKDYIELNDLNVPSELRRDQVDDLMPTIKEGEVVEEFRARNDARKVRNLFRYPSDCDHNKKIRIDCAHNLKFSCMIDFAVLEDMDAFRDEGMGDVIFGEPFLREVRINAKRFEGMITIYNGNEEVTYQMVRSHPRFKHHINEQCNKIPPLLKDLAEKKSRMLVEYLQIWKSGSVGVLKL
ncbi:retrovirus-related pol polyprotein from transposon TNT 1-94 [Tanacetum coccineum]